MTTSEFLETCLQYGPNTYPQFDFESIRRMDPMVISGSFPPMLSQPKEVTLELNLSTHLLNRTQWYQLQCKFSTNGRPVFVGQPVTINPSVAFCDSRKRLAPPPNISPNSPLILSVFGACSLTGRSLQKCKKCKEQDKVTTNRKRKRDSGDTWSEVDQENNSKLFHVLETGCHKVGNDGTLNLRFRTLCCIGAARQFHRNHIISQAPNDSPEEEEETHKGCEGFSLIVVVKTGHTELCQIVKEPVRVVGKVTKNGGSGGVTTPVPNKEPPPTFDHFHIARTKSPYLIGKPSSVIRSGDGFLTNTPPTPSPVTAFPLETSFIFHPIDHHYETESPIPSEVNGNRKMMENFLLSEKERELLYIRSYLPSNFDNGNFRITTKRSVPSHFPTEKTDNRWTQTDRGCPLRPEERHGFSLNEEDPLGGDNGHVCQLFSIFGKDHSNCASLHKIALVYQTRFDPIFSLSYRPIFEPDFFNLTNLLQIPLESPIMLHIYNTLGVGYALRKNGKKKERLFLMAEELACKLLQKLPVMELSDIELLYLADAICRTAVIEGSSGKFANATYFSKESYRLYEILATRQPSTRLRPCYELMTWIRISVNPDPAILQQVHNWASTVTCPKLMCRILTLRVLACCFPSLSKGKEEAPSQPNHPLSPTQKQLLLPLCDQLEEAFEESGYKTHTTEISPGYSTTFGRVIDLALSALRHWISWNLDAAESAIEECAIQATITTNPQLDSCPLNLAAYVAVQLAGLHLYPIFNTDRVRRVSGVVNQEGEGQEDPDWWSERPETRRSTQELSDKKRRSLNFAEILMKFSRLCVWPWGRYLDEFNQAIFDNIVSNG